MATCTSCHGTIDAQAYALQARVWAELHPGEVAPPPRRCTECAFLGLLAFAFSGDEDEEKEGC